MDQFWSLFVANYASQRAYKKATESWW